MMNRLTLLQGAAGLLLWGTDAARADAVQAAPQATGGKLTFAHSGSPGSLDLTREGTGDWVAWGPTGSQANVVRKAGVVPIIGAITLSGTPGYGATSEGTPLSWSDGAPLKSAANQDGAVFAGGVHPVWEFRIAADTTERTVKLYCGHWFCQAALDAELSDGSAPKVTWAANGPKEPEGGYTVSLTYKAASAGQTLTVRWRKVNDKDFGNVGWDAVTVSGPPRPAPDLTVALRPLADAPIAVYPRAKIKLAADVSGGKPGAVVRFWEGPYFLGETARAPYQIEADVPNFPFASFRADVRDRSGAVAVSDERMVRIYPKSWERADIDKGKLDGKYEAAPEEHLVDYTREGKLDWIHFGYPGSAVGVNRKAGVTPQISNARLTNPFQTPRLAAGYSHSATWTDGTPTPKAEKVGHGYLTGGTDNGFEFTAHADTTERTLKVYASMWGGCYGRLSAHLSDGSWHDFADDTFRSNSGFVNAVYTLKYRASRPGEVLTVRLGLHNHWVWGGIYLNGATLA